MAFQFNIDRFVEGTFNGVGLLVLVVLSPILLPLYALGRAGEELSYHLRRKGWLS
jgi:hypothetical protein